ncbi:hypothetical protein [Streptomyces liangshanensis]|uniref:Uncharacterized protein n=1 Tax=Streptomyces liangshanensis TaxID=2717324 RepID=A0A6G9HAD2_9ACTN|nr:hypothetical protein [Streptomyces liangshanensis]QIQ07007.1 hypothetical protein HA039_19240 [Streptomyces liangshanensis]
MGKPARSAWWERLPAGIRDEIDGYVLRDAMLAAIRVVVDVGRVGDGVGVGEAQLIVGDRYAYHGARIARAPESPLDLESLARRAGGAAGRVVAIEAVWDGDTVHDWFVRLLAVTADPADPAGEHTLAIIYAHTAGRHLDRGEGEDSGPRRPRREATAAETAGGALAAHLSVPFHFASPDTPDDEAPRWERPSAG